MSFAIILNHVSQYVEPYKMFYFTTPAFHLKEIFVIEPLWIACIGPPLSIPIKCIVSKHSAFQHAHTLFSISLSLSLSLKSVRARCHFADWLWKHCSNSSLLWRGSPCLLLLSLCLWELAAAHWRSYMTVKRAINAAREAEVYGCLSLP